MFLKGENMKKFFKFLFGTAAIAGIAAGLYYCYKKFFAKQEEDDDFEDDLDDFDLDDEDSSTTPEYVSITPDRQAEAAEEETPVTE